MLERSLLATAFAVIALTPAACSGAGAFRDTASSADVAFSQRVVQSHRRDLQLAPYVRQRSANATIRRIAVSSDTELRAEVNMLAGFLKSWGASVPGPPRRHVTELADARVRGLPEAEALAKTSATAFDRVAVDTLIAHRQKLMRLAASYLRTGEDRTLLGLARSIGQESPAEIAVLRSMLDEL